MYKTPHIKYFFLSLITLGYFIPEWVRVAKANKAKRAQEAMARIMACTALVQGKAQVNQIRASRAFSGEDKTKKAAAMGEAVVSIYKAATDAYNTYKPKEEL